MRENLHLEPMTLGEGMGKLQGLISEDDGLGEKLGVLEKRLMRIKRRKSLCLLLKTDFNAGS